MAKRTTELDRAAQQPEAERQPESTYSTPVAPEFTIRANTAFGIRAMMAIAHMPGLTAAEHKQMHAKLREFDLYEELTRESHT